MKARLLRKWIASGIIAVGISLLAWGLWIPVKAVVAQQLLDLAWERSQSGELDVRPWPWADILPAFRLSLPGHDRSFVVLNNSSGEALAFGPGHVSSSARPGNAGVVVIGGHRDTHFAILREMTIGDTITVENIQGTQFTYSVSEMSVRHKDEVEILVGERSHVLILTTCFPFEDLVSGSPERFLVVAKQQFS
jgi:sortase A